MKRTAIYMLFVTLLLLCACSKEYPYVPQKLVIEGWIENGESPVVQVSLTGTRSTSGEPIEEFIANWAKVTVSDGEQDYVLIGTVDTTYFPPYIYTSYDLKGEVGKNYYLTVEYKDMVATAHTTILPPVEIEDVIVTPVDGSNGWRAVEVVVTPPSDDLYYYQLRYRNFFDSHAITPSYMGLYTTTSSQQVSFPLVKAWIVEDYSPHFYAGDIVIVRLSRISRADYDFWMSYYEFISVSNNIFIQSQSVVPTNIEGGYGRWIGYGISQRKVVIY